MTQVNSVVDLRLDGEIAAIVINSPPVNALSAGVRDRIKGQAMDAWSRDAPFSFTRKRFAESGDAHIIWDDDPL